MSRRFDSVDALFIFAFLLLQLTAVLQVCADDEGIDFPPILDSDDIAYFARTYDKDGLYWALTSVFDRSERIPNNRRRVVTNNNQPLPDVLVSRGGGSTYTTAYKLKCDLEQAQYLVDHTFRNRPAERNYFLQQVIPILNETLANIPSLDNLERSGGLYAFRRADKDRGIEEVYNKALYVPEYALNGPVLNPDLDMDVVQRDWVSKQASGEPGIAVVDDILSEEALQKVRDLLLESTVWYQTKMPHKFGGYVGAYIDDGLYQKILLTLAFDLHRALPKIMKDHPLKYMWAYKYDSDYTGINTHADQAAVNVNLWITPDDANLDSNSGGLVIFTAKPPSDWDFTAYNTDTERVDRDILAPTNYANVTVPYRANRAVIFDSALFHHTDKFSFKEGYRNRRINLTLLYGDMQFDSPKTGEL